jgi:four helix bundle suffix protein
MELYRKCGGYRRLDSYFVGNIIQLATLAFCRRFLNRSNDPCGRQTDQMTQAARSGIKNVVEGQERLKTSVSDCIRLMDVGRASLCELRDDYITWLLDKENVPWRQDSPEAQAVFGIRLDTVADYWDDINHDSCVHLLKQKTKFKPWLDSEDSVAVANALLVLLTREINMLDNQLAKLAEDFKQEGGFRERMTAVRVEAKRERKEAVNEDAPVCVACGQPMRLRNGKRGQFWGCSAYPTCKGTQEVTG